MGRSGLDWVGDWTRTIRTRGIASACIAENGHLGQPEVSCHEQMRDDLSSRSLARSLTPGFFSLSISAHASVACPACAAILPFCILRLSFTTNTSFTSSVQLARTPAMSDAAAAASSSASESVSVAPSPSLVSDDGADESPFTRPDVDPESEVAESLRFLLDEEGVVERDREVRYVDVR